MAFFAKLFRKNVFLGVDIGTSSIKAVEITYENHKPYLTNYGSITIRDISMRSQVAPSIHKGIMALIREMHVKATRLYVALPSSNGLVALLEFPEMSEKELEQAVRFEAHKYIPADMDDVALSWEIIRRMKKKGGSLIQKEFGKEEKEDAEEEHVNHTQEVLLVGALKSDVALLSSHFQKAQYDIHAIEIESFSLARSLTRETPGEALIVDIGHSICNLALVSDGVIRISRNIDVGGKGVTETIADSMNVSLSKAESIKKGKDDLFHKKEMSLVFSSLDVVVGEAERIISSYEKRHQDKKVTTIILSGGTSGMVGLGEFMKEKLGRKVEVGDPFRGIEYDRALQPYIEKMKGTFAVAVGLALRGVDDFRRGA